ncbi:hypothetical protein D3C86_1511400 [compost metagenome]
MQHRITEAAGLFPLALVQLVLVLGVDGHPGHLRHSQLEQEGRTHVDTNTWLHGHADPAPDPAAATAALVSAGAPLLPGVKPGEEYAALGGRENGGIGSRASSLGDLEVVENVIGGQVDLAHDPAHGQTLGLVDRLVDHGDDVALDDPGGCRPHLFGDQRDIVIVDTEIRTSPRHK